MIDLLFNYKCKVIRVIDGDTVVVDIDLGFNHWIRNQHVRLYGIDTPEVRTKDLAEKKLGFEAKEFVQARFFPGDIVILRSIEDSTGKFGRILGEFYYNDKDKGYINISEELLNAGLAKIITK